MKKNTKIAGISLIIAAIAMAFYAIFDGDDSTKVDVEQTVQQVQKGVDLIKQDTSTEPVVEVKE